MTVGRPLRATIFAAAWSVVAAPSPAQLTGTLEAAVSRVHYDDFLPSDALSLGTAFGAQNRTLAFGARGSYLRFESGNSTWQTSVTGSGMVPRLGPTRPEIWAAGGGSQYVDYPAFWHAFGGTRLHFDLDQGTAWLDGSIGRTSFGDEQRPVTTIGAGAWTRRLGATVTIAASYVEVGETTYTDLQGTARREYRAIEVDGILGARLWSNGGGEGIYGEARIAILTGSYGAIVFAGGRYPTDPTRGTISGRYLSAGFRLRAPTPVRRRSPPFPTLPSAPRGSPANGSAPRLELQAARRDSIRLVVLVPVAAALVELAGDFTEWRPVALAPRAPGRWELVLSVPRGRHRINVRIDGGPWVAPEGTARSPDDYGGEAGSFVIP